MEEKIKWRSFRLHKAENYVELVETLVTNYGKMGCRMSIDFDPDHSMLGLLDDYPNLIVLQTFSKAWIDVTAVVTKHVEIL